MTFFLSISVACVPNQATKRNRRGGHGGIDIHWVGCIPFFFCYFLLPGDDYGMAEKGVCRIAGEQVLLDCGATPLSFLLCIRHGTTTSTKQFTSSAMTSFPFFSFWPLARNVTQIKREIDEAILAMRCTFRSYVLWGWNKLIAALIKERNKLKRRMHEKISKY